MKKTFLILFGALLICLTDCAGPFRTLQPDPDIAPLLLIRKIHDHAAKLQTIQGSARLVVNSEMGNFQGSLNLKARLPDSLYAKVEGPFGVDVAAMQLHADTLLLYSPLMQTVYRSALNDSSTEMLPVPISAGDFMLYVMGLMVIPESRADEISMVTIKDGQYILYFKNREHIYVHPRGPVITQWVKTDDQGQNLWSWKGLNFKKSGGIRLPQTIRIQAETPKQIMTIHYLSRQANKRLKSGWSRLKLPEGVNHIAL